MDHDAGGRSRAANENLVEILARDGQAEAAGEKARGRHAAARRVAHAVKFSAPRGERVVEVELAQNRDAGG